MASFTTNQYLVLILLVFSKFVSTIIWSLQAPFYPAEAKNKNATTIDSGIVLGIYEIMVFIFCPVVSIYILPAIGAFTCFHFGYITSALSTLAFGFLDRVYGRFLFIGLSITLRICEAFGNSCVFISTYTFSHRMFPESIGTVFGILESTFAIGLAAGPPIGGLLFELGTKVLGHGFVMPFLTVGSTMLLTSIATFFVIPTESDLRRSFKAKSQSGKVVDDADSPDFGFFQLLRIKRVILFALAVVCGGVSVGFLAGTLEPHLRQFELTPSITGIVFLTYGGVYAATSFIWGMLSDRTERKEILTLTGSMIILISFIIIGPIPWIPIPASSLAVTETGLAFYGLGLGGILISVYSLLLKEAKHAGFPDSKKTSALVAGLWMESIALGAFTGPILGSSLLDYFGFRVATLSIVVIFLILSGALTVTTFTVRAVSDETLPILRSQITFEEGLRKLKK